MAGPQRTRRRRSPFSRRRNPTAGWISARCHDEQANNLALNLAHEIVTGRKTVDEARAYYAKKFLDYRRKVPTPYMDRGWVNTPARAGDADQRVLSDADLERAVREGEQADP